MDLVLGTLTPPSPGRARDRRGTAAGFSLIEVLVALLILLFILLGVVPLFLRATASRQSGRESTAVGSFARTRAESLLQLPFDHRDLTVPPGSTALEVTEYRLAGSDVWQRSSSLEDQAVWTRLTRVRQFSAADLMDGDTDGDGDDLDNPLDGGTALGVHLKQIEVRITSPREGGPFGAGEEITLRVLKGF